MGKFILLLKRLELNIQQYLQNVTKSGHKSTVLMPLTWLIATLVGGSSIMFAIGKTPQWIPTVLMLIAFAVIVLFVGCYIYCLTKDPDLIRSEKFVTDKLMIERGIYGDETRGLSEQIIDTEVEVINTNIPLENA